MTAASLSPSCPVPPAAKASSSASAPGSSLLRKAEWNGANAVVEETAAAGAATATAASALLPSLRRHSTQPRPRPPRVRVASLRGFGGLEGSLNQSLPRNFGRGGLHQSLPPSFGGSGHHPARRRRSSAISTESHDLSQLAELAELAEQLAGDHEEEGDGGERKKEREKEALARFNTKHDSRWVDFAAAPLPSLSSADSGGGDDGGNKEDIGGEGGVGKGGEESGVGGSSIGQVDGGPPKALAAPDAAEFTSAPPPPVAVGESPPGDAAPTAAVSTATRNQRKASVLWRNGAPSSLLAGSALSDLSLDSVEFDDDSVCTDDFLLEVEEGDEEEEESDNISYEGERRKRVRFGAGLNLCYPREHISRSEITPSECLSCWYDERDHSDIQMDIIQNTNFYRPRWEVKTTEEEGGEGTSDASAVCAIEAEAVWAEEDEEREGMCPRGLEHVIRESDRTRRYDERYAMWEAVWTAQELQWRRWYGEEEGEEEEEEATVAADDDGTEAIASAARSVSSLSVARAIERARLDAKEVVSTVRPKSRLSHVRFRLAIKRAQAGAIAAARRRGRGGGGSAQRTGSGGRSGQ